MMKRRFSRIFCIALCMTPLMAAAQTYEGSPAAQRLYEEGRTLFRQKAYAAALTPLKAFVQQTEACGEPTSTAGSLLEAEYMLVCAEYELHNPQSTRLILDYLDQHPDAPQANRLYALAASNCFFAEDYEQALAYFNAADLSRLGGEERNDMTYRLALSLLKTGNPTEAAAWFRVVQEMSGKYREDCTYYLAYIAYTQQRYDEALPGFLTLQESGKYGIWAPYYIAEIYLSKGQYDKAEIVAQNYLSAYPGQEHAGEMHRVEGTVRYHRGDYQAAMEKLDRYLETARTPRRDALYMQGIACYECGAYTRVPELLADVTRTDDALAQNAWLHIGLADLELDERNSARMAFEQAAASDADLKVKEQAAYNHALCIHETSYSAFGESVTVFEKFLNEFPQSQYADRVSGYLVEVYMTTRSYEAALQSIDRIARPGRSILEAKQKILFQLGTQAFTNTSFEKAIGHFDQSIALGQYNLQTKADAYYWRGESYYRLNRFAESARDFRDYLSLTTRHDTEMYALAHYNLGYIAFHQKDFEEAQNRFLSFVRLHRETNNTVLADAYNRIGDCYLNGRHFSDARQYYTLSEQLNTPGGDYALYQSGLVAGLQKNYTEKAALLDQLAAKYPDSPYNVNALYEKGRSYVQNNQSDQAIAIYQELVDKYPASPVSRKAAAEIGLIHAQNNRFAQAVQAYKQVITQYPGSEEARLAWRDLKSLYVDANRVEDFAALASEMPGGLRFEPSEQDSLTYIAAEKVYMKGEPQPAKESFTRYLQTFPDGAFTLNAHYHLCTIAQTEKDEDAVLEHAGKLLEYPDNPYSEEALVMRAEVLFKRKQYGQALTDYKQLQAKASTPARRRLGTTGVMRCAVLMKDDVETIHAATALLGEAKLTPELRNEALYDRAKAYLSQKADRKATADLKELAADTRTLYGAEAKYLLAEQLYQAADYAGAEKELLDFIDQSTPHAYWLARGFILLSDVYAAMGKTLEARQYLLSLQQNYQADDDIEAMIEERLEKMKEQ